MKFYMVFITLFAALAGMTLGNFVGVNSQKKIDLDHCKKAGWAFIDRKFNLVGVSEEESKNIYMDLQASIATECIVRINNN